MSEALLKKLEELNKAHIGEGVAIMKAFGGVIYPFDLLTYGVLNRSMSLTSGFITLVRADNYVAATTLVRPQLDNFLRYAAGWLVANPHDFATKILHGTPVKKQKTADGQLMTDRFLVDHFKKDHPWLDRVYTETSGFIHLSEKHMLMNVTETDPGKRTATFSISDKHTRAVRDPDGSNNWIHRNHKLGSPLCLQLAVHKGKSAKSQNRRANKGGLIKRHCLFGWKLKFEFPEVKVASVTERDFMIYNKPVILPLSQRPSWQKNPC